MSLRLDNISLRVGEFELSLSVQCERPITGIFGSSGAGKTSLLDVIAGLRRPESGKVQLGAEVLSDAAAGLHLPPRLRRIGYVPQDLALFPHLNARKNLLYGYRPTLAQSEQFTLEHVAEVMEIEALLERDVTTLSGGEKQRVAFARAVLSAPRLLLLDEPMSSLDERLKMRLIPYLRRIREEFGIPLVYVSHDASELAALCDEVLRMEAGRIIHQGTPAEILSDK